VAGRQTLGGILRPAAREHQEAGLAGSPGPQKIRNEPFIASRALVPTNLCRRLPRLAAAHTNQPPSGEASKNSSGLTAVRTAYDVSAQTPPGAANVTE